MKKLIIPYLLIGVVVSVYTYFCGDTRHQGFAHNLGGGLVWPVRIFSWDPEIDADTKDSYAQSYVAVLRSAQKHNLLTGVNLASNLLAFKLYAEQNPSVPKSDFEALFQDSDASNAVISAAQNAVNNSPKLTQKFMDEMDDYSAGELYDDVDDIKSDIEGIMASHPATGPTVAEASAEAVAQAPAEATAAAEPLEAASSVTSAADEAVAPAEAASAPVDTDVCVGQKAADYRRDAGDINKAISPETMTEWEAACSQPPAS